MIDTTKLRELAQKSVMTAENRDEYSANYGAFVCTANPSTVLALLDDIDALAETMRYMRVELEKLRTIESAARNLAKVKGRHHSELAMNQLLEALK